VEKRAICSGRGNVARAIFLALLVYLESGQPVKLQETGWRRMLSTYGQFASHSASSGPEDNVSRLGTCGKCLYDLLSSIPNCVRIFSVVLPFQKRLQLSSDVNVRLRIRSM
jgi:hypothetical protein